MFFLLCRKNMRDGFSFLLSSSSPSCTNFLSKVFERFVLRWAKAEVMPKTNQYGGQPGCSTNHFLVDFFFNPADPQGIT